MAFDNPVTGERELGIKKVRYSHDGMIDLIIAKPWIRQFEIAAHFGLTEAWVSQIMTSDSFKHRLEQRRHELIDPEIRLAIEQQFETVARLSLNVLAEKLEITRSEKLALSTLTVVSKAMGYGAKAETATTNVSWFQQIVNQNGGHTSILASEKQNMAIAAQPVAPPGPIVTISPAEACPFGESSPLPPTPHPEYSPFTHPRAYATPARASGTRDNVIPLRNPLTGFTSGASLLQSSPVNPTTPPSTPGLRGESDS